MPVDVYLQARTPELTDEERGPTARVGYMLRGSQDEIEVYAALLAEAPVLYQDLWRIRAGVIPLGGPIWEGFAEYGIPQTPPDSLLGDPTDPGQTPPASPGDNDLLGPEFSFATSGGTEKLVMTKETKHISALAGLEAPPLLGLIGLKDDGEVEGVEIPAFKADFVITAHVKMTPKYARLVTDYTGTINDRKWFGWEAGQVLFVGYDGSYKSKSAGWSGAYKFAIAKHRVGTGRDPEDKIAPGLFLGRPAIPAIPPDPELDVPGAPAVPALPVVKRGWDYLWCGYKDDTAQGRAVKRPWYFVIDQVFEERDFRKLGLGG